ncbi:uncharacterized protein LOC110892557 [Helianthus annuus]|uniref:uncharacterized protein LOC110892557 n=1 Tax=Helianthus annuus TaxID=4232 RepID=UPI000B8F0EFE|nr:uncharacterized protein LOC110892557 [Helianthus annuus]
MKLNGKNINRAVLGNVGNGEHIRFWLDKWVGDLPFVERWPHLFALESVKNCRVVERMGSRQGNDGYTWNWVRTPESDVEIKEWQECQEVINMVRLSNKKDAWIWDIDRPKGFSMNSVKKALISDRESCFLPKFEWSKWVPIKCNIMAWRGNLDILATKVNLKKSNVDIPSVLCPFCEEYEETVDHLFSACTVSIRVWATFSVWCNIPQIFAFDFKDLMDIHNNIQSGKKTKKIIRGLIIIACWCIWKGRNDLVFNQIRRSSQDIMIEIKSRGFWWFKSRSSCENISWKDWCKYPMYML